MARGCVAWIVMMALTGCSCSAAFGGADFPSGAGATPGGAQDVGSARLKVARGEVPKPADFVVEGLLSEHDLPLEGPPCTERLCVRPALGIAPSFETDRPEIFLQLGFSSNVDLSTFHRPPLNLAVVVDISGSMAQDGKLDAVKGALTRLVAQLDERDLLTLVAFDDRAELVLDGVLPSSGQVGPAIGALETRGGTCIECGLKKGYELVERHAEASRENRVMLFTDAQPNVGAVDGNDFVTLVKAHDSTVGLTAFGVGIDFGQELALAISETRGGNYFFLEDAEKVRRVFDDEFDMLVTPLAYDLTLSVRPSPGIRIAAVHGLPGFAPGQDTAELHVATVFLSNRRGAIVLRLTGDPAPGASVASLFFGVADASGPRSEVELAVSYDGAAPLGPEEAWFSQDGVRRTVALTNFALGAKRVCTDWWTGRHAEAKALATRVTAAIAAEAEALHDDGLRDEAEFARALEALVVK